MMAGTWNHLNAEQGKARTAFDCDIKKSPTIALPRKAGVRRPKKNYSFLFFSQYNIIGSVETYIETSLRLNWDFCENFSRPSQPETRSLDHPFESLVRESLVQILIDKTILSHNY